MQSIAIDDFQQMNVGYLYFVHFQQIDTIFRLMLCYRYERMGKRDHYYPKHFIGVVKHE